MNRVVVIESDLKGNFSSDLAKMANRVREEVEHQNREGYKVQSVTNLTTSADTTSSDDYPYVEVFTAGVLIIFEQVQD